MIAQGSGDPSDKVLPLNYYHRLLTVRACNHAKSEADHGI
jgi:hypothetical protein